MQNQNAYERLYINPTNQTQVVQQTNIQASYPQANYAYYVEQQPNQNQQVLICQPQSVQDPIIENPNLIKCQSRLVRMQFSIGATLINWIQEIAMIAASFLELSYDTRNIQDYEDNKGSQIKNYSEYPQYYLYILIAVTLACLISSKFIKPPKNYALQILIQVGMTILYMLVAAGITYFTFPDSIYYSCMLVVHFFAYLSILIGIYNQAQGQSLMKRFSIVNFLIIITVVLMSGLLILGTGDTYALLIIFFLVILGLIIYIWSLLFGMLYIFSLIQLLKGQCNLEKTASILAASIVYANLIIMC